MSAYFGIVILCSLPGISLNPWYSWWGDFVHMGGVFAQLHLFLYFFVLTQAIKKERDWLVLLTASIFFAVFMGLTGLIQSMGFDEIFRPRYRGTRIMGATGNSGYFGTYMLLNFFIALYLLIRRNKAEVYPYIAKIWLILLIVFDLFLLSAATQLLSDGLALFPIVFFAVLLHGLTLFWFFIRQKTWAGMVFLGLLCLYFFYWLYQSQTRAVIVGLAGSAALVSVFYVFAGSSRRLKLSAGLLVLLIVLLPPVLFLNKDSSWIQDNRTLRRLTGTSLEEHRFLVWEAAVKSILDRPFLGWGRVNFRNAFDRHAPAEIFAGDKPENWYDRAHNLILDIGVTTGLLGLGAYLSFYLFIFMFLISNWFRTKDAANSLILVAFVSAYLIQGLFTFDTANTDGTLYLVLAFIAYLAGIKGLDRTERSDLPPPVRLSLSGRNCLILAGITGILITANIYTVQRPYKANLLLLEGTVEEKDNNSQSQQPRYVFRQAAVDAFKAAEDLNTTGRYEVREIFADYAYQLSMAADVSPDDKIRVAKMAIASLEKSLLEEPLTVRHCMYFSMVVRRIFEVLKQSDPKLATSLTERSITQLANAEILSPTRWRIPFERAQALGTIGRMDEAISAMKKAIRLNPTVAMPRIELISMYIVSERYKDAEEEWRKVADLALPVKPTEYERIIELFAAKKQFAQVVSVRKHQIQLNPDDGELWAKLAVAYRELGDLDSATQAAVKAANLSPEIDQELNDFLKSLEKISKK